MSNNNNINNQNSVNTNNNNNNNRDLYYRSSIDSEIMGKGVYDVNTENSDSDSGTETEEAVEDADFEVVEDEK